MRGCKFYLMILPLILITSGCDAETTKEAGGAKSNVIAPQNFQSHHSSAKKFWELRRKGSELRKQGQYEGALEIFKEALKNYAYLKPEQAVAASHIAMTYEDMSDYENAIKYYELSSEVTLSTEQRNKFLSKAQELRKKVSLTKSS